MTNLPHIENPHPENVGRRELLNEISKTQGELANAIFKHRNAWAKAANRQRTLRASCLDRHPDDLRAATAELAAICETDMKFKRYMGDVKFWAAERTAIATSLAALQGMLARPPQILDGMPHQRQG